MPADKSAPGIEIFGYVIERLLGKGGMGTVYLARQKSLDRRLAIKLMHSHRCQNKSAVQSFLREARIAGQLNHPNLAAIHDVHADEALGLYCYSMEYVDGITASRLVAKHGPLNRARALNIIFQIAQALGHAHHRGMVHRDVKPDNILVTADDTAKLLDLGLVSERIPEQPHQSRILSIIGTPEYSAPEQHRNPAAAVPASDVYSLGATLYFLLVGRPPISGETVIDLIVRVATEMPSYPASITPDCRRLLELMLAKHSADRLSDGEAVVEALRIIATGGLPPLPLGLAEAGEAEMFEEDVGGAVASSRPRAMRRRRYR